MLDAVAGATGEFARLKIEHETEQRGTFAVDDPIVALFNPNQLRFEQRAEWRAAATIAQSVAGGYQRMEFQATPPMTLAIDLFFDTYEGKPAEGANSLLGSLQDALVPDNPFATGTPSATPVTTYTARVAKLATVSPDLHRPPVCKLLWGQTELFRGVLTQLHQDYTFFTPNGTPVRATLQCTFTAYRTFGEAVSEIELHSSDVPKRRVVRRGDTLSGIAQNEYGDAARWRAIAIANHIDNPRTLAPGLVLVIPKLER
ncbi:MAG TPA: LysM peptidoglycan-binding domain-containing protein [Kofleriaceae bacterium]